MNKCNFSFRNPIKIHTYSFTTATFNNTIAAVKRNEELNSNQSSHTLVEANHHSIQHQHKITQELVHNSKDSSSTQHVLA